MKEEYLFVYGVFRDTAKTLLQKPTHCGKAKIKGKLYRVNDFYPGWIPGEGEVVGDVYLINPDILPQLDEFEGKEYMRVKVRTSTDLDCWVYKWIEPIDGFQQIKGGDWMLR